MEEGTEKHGEGREGELLKAARAGVAAARRGGLSDAVGVTTGPRQGVRLGRRVRLDADRCSRLRTSEEFLSSLSSLEVEKATLERRRLCRDRARRVVSACCLELPGLGHAQRRSLLLRQETRAPLWPRRSAKNTRAHRVGDSALTCWACWRQEGQSRAGAGRIRQAGEGGAADGREPRRAARAEKNKAGPERQARSRLSRSRPVRSDSSVALQLRPEPTNLLPQLATRPHIHPTLASKAPFPTLAKMCVPKRARLCVTVR